MVLHRDGVRGDPGEGDLVSANVLSTLSLLFVAFAIWLVVRNCRVLSFREHLRRIVKGHRYGEFQQELCEELDSVKYSEMILAPFRTLESFYQETYILSFYRESRRWRSPKWYK